jgi:hypothetical protein
MKEIKNIQRIYKNIKTRSKIISINFHSDEKKNYANKATGKQQKIKQFICGKFTARQPNQRGNKNQTINQTVMNIFAK